MIKVEIRPIKVDGTKIYDTEKVIKLFGITVFRKRVFFPRNKIEYEYTFKI